MKVMFIGDIVGKKGREKVKELTKKYRDEYNLDFVIANAENSAHGKGVTKKIYNDLLNNGIDFITLDIAWIAQHGISSTAYYWKSKSDNKTKIPIKVISSLPQDMRDNIDITQVIVASIQSD